VSMRRSWRAHWRLILVGALLGAGGLICTLILLFQHIPAWYRPMRVAPEDYESVRNDLTNTEENLTLTLNAATEPFEYRISEQQINAWMSAREGIWPLSREWLPSTLSDPMIWIDDGAIRLAATYRDGSLKTVVSIQFHIEGDTEGIQLQLADIAGGSLPVPRSWAKGELAKLDANGWPAGKMVRRQYAGPSLPLLTDLLDAATFPNAWIWYNGDIPFRISRLVLEKGQIVLTIEPLRRQVDTRRSTQPP